MAGGYETTAFQRQTLPLQLRRAHRIGQNTAADEIIRRAGGINAAAAIDGLKPMTREAWIAAKPDIIIIADHNTAMIGNVKTFAARPEIAGSPAAKNGKIYLWKAKRYVPLWSGYATSDSAFAWFGEINAPVLKTLPDFCFQTASICSFLLSRKQNGCLKNAV